MSLAQVRDLTDEERVSRAVAILETIPVAGYCREVPPLEEVIRSSGCCSFVTKVAELNGTSYREDERGEIVEMTYSCVGLDGGRYIAAILVDLETAGMAPIYSDPNARHLSYTVGGGSFPEARGSE